MENSNELSKKDLLENLKKDGVIKNIEDWDNLTIKQLTELGKIGEKQKAPAELSDEEKDKLQKEYVSKLKLSGKEKEELKEKYLEQLAESDEGVAAEIVKRRKLEQENRQIRQDVKRKLEELVALVK